MKSIYFACSIRGGRNDADTYAKLVAHIKTQAQVLSEIFADGALTAAGMDKPDQQIWQTDTDWVKQADGIIAEVTNPSLGVGYEIALAEQLGKPILALFNTKLGHKLSAMIAGAPGVRVVRYDNIDTACTAISAFIEDIHWNK